MQPALNDPGDGRGRWKRPFEFPILSAPQGGYEDYGFGLRLKQARQRVGWAQTELGKRSGVHAMAISRLERRGKKDVTGAILRKLSIALRVSAGWLLGLVDDDADEEAA